MKLMIAIGGLCLLLAGGFLALTFQAWRAGKPAPTPVRAPASGAAPDAHEPPQSPADGRNRGDAVSPAATPPSTAAPAARATQDSVRWSQPQGKRAALRRLESARAALEIEPDHPAALREAAAAARELGRWALASAFLTRLVELDADDGEAVRQQADAQMRLSRWVEAVSTLSAVVRRQPDDRESWHNLATAHQALGHLLDARMAWDRVLALRGDDCEALARRGEVLLDLSDWQAAAADFDAAARLCPQDREIPLNLALALGRAGDAEAALGVLRRQVELAPRDVPALLRLAEACLEQAARVEDGAALREEARTACERVLQVAPDQREALALRREAQRAAP